MTPMPPLITIRDDQMSQLSHGAVDRLVADLLRHAANTFPDVMAPHSLAEQDLLVRSALARANCYGLWARQDLYRFINLHGFLGWDFLDLEASAWMRNWLASETRGPPGARLLSLQQKILFNAEMQRRAGPVL